MDEACTSANDACRNYKGFVTISKTGKTCKAWLKTGESFAYNEQIK